MASWLENLFAKKKILQNILSEPFSNEMIPLNMYEQPF